MFYHAKNGSVTIGDTEMDYVSFGRGSDNLVMIPGLSDALKTVKGSAAALALMYRQYTKNYTVYVFSRKNKMEEGYSTKDMARDQAAAMKKLGILKSAVMGVSQGGMIAQYLAVDYPELVNKLILAVTVSGQNETVRRIVGGWIEMAKANDYKGLILDTAEKSYSTEHFKKHRLRYSILGRVGKPKDFSRFLIQANACIRHEATNELQKIRCPVLVIGGDSDKVVGKKASEDLVARIPESRLVLYKGLGHMAYAEAKDFNAHVLDFLNG